MIYPDVPSFTPEELSLLCEEYRENNYIDPKTSEKLGVKRGLRNPDGTGVLTGLTNICDVVGYERDENGNVIPCDGKLIYRGIDLMEFVHEAMDNDRFMFEEVVWLLLFGSLPTEDQLSRFRSLLENHRELPDGFAETMIMSAPSPNIMNKMARSVLALYSYDDDCEVQSLENEVRIAVSMIAHLPVIMSAAYQVRVIGPAPEQISKVKDMYRQALYLKGKDDTSLKTLRKHLEEYIAINPGFRDIYMQYDHH